MMINMLISVVAVCITVRIKMWRADARRDLSAGRATDRAYRYVWLVTVGVTRGHERREALSNALRRHPHRAWSTGASILRLK